MRKLYPLAAIALLPIATLTGSAGVASAAVVVPPGGSGNTCSGYKYLNADRYWQTCAWADADSVWFTINFGNASNADWAPDKITLDYFASATQFYCSGARWTYPNFVIPKHSNKATPRSVCQKSRVAKGGRAYQSDAYVEDGPDKTGMLSPTLQVQD
jgi:hypothetical protein